MSGRYYIFLLDTEYSGMKSVLLRPPSTGFARLILKSFACWIRSKEYIGKCFKPKTKENAFVYNKAFA